MYHYYRLSKGHKKFFNEFYEITHTKSFNLLLLYTCKEFAQVSLGIEDVDLGL